MGSGVGYYGGYCYPTLWGAMGGTVTPPVDSTCSDQPVTSRVLLCAAPGQVVEIAVHSPAAHRTGISDRRWQLIAAVALYEIRKFLSSVGAGVH